MNIPIPWRSSRFVAELTGSAKSLHGEEQDGNSSGESLKKDRDTTDPVSTFGWILSDKSFDVGEEEHFLNLESEGHLKRIFKPAAQTSSSVFFIGSE